MEIWPGRADRNTASSKGLIPANCAVDNGYCRHLEPRTGALAIRVDMDCTPVCARLIAGEGRTTDDNWRIGTARPRSLADGEPGAVAAIRCIITNCAIDNAQCARTKKIDTCSAPSEVVSNDATLDGQAPFSTDTAAAQEGSAAGDGEVAHGEVAAGVDTEYLVVLVTFYGDVMAGGIQDQGAIDFDPRRGVDGAVTGKGHGALTHQRCLQRAHAGAELAAVGHGARRVRGRRIVQERPTPKQGDQGYQQEEAMPHHTGNARRWNKLNKIHD